MLDRSMDMRFEKLVNQDCVKIHALLALGPRTISQLSQEARLSGPRVRSLLEFLEKKGKVQIVHSIHDENKISFVWKLANNSGLES